MHMVERAHNDGVGKVQIRIYAPIRLVEGDVCDHKRYSSWRVHLDGVCMHAQHLRHG